MSAGAAMPKPHLVGRNQPDFHLTERQMLVGSDGAATSGDFSKASGGANLWHNLRPVSYTHLTLPTIYSV